MRRRRILFVEFVACMEDTRQQKCVIVGERVGAGQCMKILHFKTLGEIRLHFCYPPWTVAWNLAEYLNRFIKTTTKDYCNCLATMTSRVLRRLMGPFLLP